MVFRGIPDGGQVVSDGPTRTSGTSQPRWEASEQRRRDAGVTRYLEWLATDGGRSIPGPDELWRWSVGQPGAFWSSVWDFCAVRGDRGGSLALVRDDRSPLGAGWFPDATVNYARNALARRGRAPALIAVREDVTTTVLSWNELRAAVAAAAAGLRRLGVGPGDVVCAVLPACAATVVAMLATACLGAVWAAAAPQDGLDRAAELLGPLSPAVLLVADGYHRSGFPHDLVPDLPRLAAALPTAASTVVVGAVSPPDAAERAAKVGLTGVIGWEDLVAEPAEPFYAAVPFDTPLWVTPLTAEAGSDAVVHGHGGIVLDTLKTLVLHLDLGPDDRLLVDAPVGSLAWQSTVSGLLAGAAVVLYDGDPGYPDASTLWRLADAAQVTSFAAEAATFASWIRTPGYPRTVADLSSLRTLASIGGLPAGFHPWVREAVGEAVYPVPVVGGTGVAGALAVGLPTAPSRPGEVGPPALGCALAVVDADGHPTAGFGELIVAGPVPSLPVSLWNDPGGHRLRSHHLLGGAATGATWTANTGWRTNTHAGITPDGSIVLPDVF
jgi:acetoacetyl-CoA synthetase